MKLPDMPFSILILAIFDQKIEDQEEIYFRKDITPLSVETVDEALKSIGPSVTIAVSKTICPDGYIEFSPLRMRHFNPDNMAECTPYIKSLCDAREFLDKGLAGGLSINELASQLKSRWSNLPLNYDFKEPEKKEKEHNTTVDDILSMVAMSEGASKKRTQWDNRHSTLKEQIDTLLSMTLESIFNDSKFRALEATWRGLEAVVKESKIRGEGEVRIMIVPTSLKMLSHTLVKLTEDFSPEPPGLVLIDFPFDNSVVSIELIEKVGEFASTLLVPTVLWLTPQFFHIDNWNQLHRLPYLKTYTEKDIYAKWNKLRETPGGQWLVAACNRFLVRFAYGDDLRPRITYFTEKSPPFISPVWAVGALMAKSVKRFGLPTRFTDIENIKIEDLGLLKQEDNRMAPTEALITSDRIRQFAEIGITVLAGVAMKDMAYIPIARTISGESVSLQCFTSSLIHFLIKSRDFIGLEIKPEEVALSLMEAISSFFTRTGHNPPSDLSIEPLMAEGKTIMRISLTPPSSVLAEQRKVTLDLLW
ncbi:MAG: type VI secretion system contractile sheath large subunit [Syntrophorhabdaceae bacterium]|nr:type VI secretion system contractile sheath large subunit [Syntrophorhabdaceae bacterium]